MRHTEIQPPFSGTATHPYIASVALDPVQVGRFVRLTEDQPDIRLLGIDNRTADRWTVFVACASKTGCDLLESEW
jgi:hypothetical protein